MCELHLKFDSVCVNGYLPKSVKITKKCVKHDKSEANLKIWNLALSLKQSANICIPYVQIANCSIINNIFLNMS